MHILVIIMYIAVVTVVTAMICTVAGPGGAPFAYIMGALAATGSFVILEQSQ